MSKVRQLLNEASVETAIRGRICHHNRKKHSIAANTKCLVVKEGATGGSKNYCPVCAAEILAQVDKDLASLRSAFLAG